MSNLLFEDETYAIRGACFEVYKEMGSGFLESVYQECLMIELAKRSIPFVAQERLSLDYKGVTLKSQFVPDLICYGEIILELKALHQICDTHRAQLHNYLKTSQLQLGLLLNFGHHPGVEIERIIR